MLIRQTLSVLAVSGLLVASLTGCGSDGGEPAVEASSTVEPGTGYLTEPPKKADDAATDANSATQETQDAVDSLEGE